MKGLFGFLFNFLMFFTMMMTEMKVMGVYDGYGYYGMLYSVFDDEL